MFLPVDEQLNRICDGVAEIVPEAELVEKLKRSLAEREPLVVKQGFDLSATPCRFTNCGLSRSWATGSCS
jgi:tyrosyl-tRNA synthetase